MALSNSEPVIVDADSALPPEELPPPPEPELNVNNCSSPIFITSDEPIFESKSIELIVSVLKFVGIINVEDDAKNPNVSFICVEVIKKISI